MASQLVYIKANRSIYFPVALEQFESAQGIYDFASGSKTDITNVTIPTPARAPAAPLAAFGFRIEKFVQRATPDQDVANQKAVGRIAFNLEEKPGTPGIAAGATAEQIRFVIDKVELSSDAKGELVAARVQDGAQMTVYGRNAAGTEVRETIPLPNGAVKLVPLEWMLDPGGDTTSVMLVVDLETAFSQAGDKLAALADLAGQFSMQVTMSFAQLVRPGVPASGTTPAVERRELTGQSISVNGLPPVTGWGVSGNAWVRMYPPQ
ncbi:hypothetical protein E4K72_02475 [Oxalobacteraceae bacterium OM1]|nr:hypothetical protein E4K72_02475 [Oxalobacteraceae bacterium OM1]